MIILVKLFSYSLLIIRKIKVPLFAGFNCIYKLAQESIEYLHVVVDGFANTQAALGWGAQTPALTRRPPDGKSTMGARSKVIPIPQATLSRSRIVHL